MLKSTHKPSGQASLPQGWTEHKAPTGHTYYYNASTKQSTYTRPSETSDVFPTTQGSSILLHPGITPSQSFLQYQSVGKPVSNTVANPNISLSHDQFNDDRGGHSAYRGGGGGFEQQRDRRPQPVDKPKSKHLIPGCEPWLLVNTKLGRRFVYNPDKNQSYWRIPEKLKDGILALDQQRIREKAEALAANRKDVEMDKELEASQKPDQENTMKSPIPKPAGNDEESSEYEEVEVTDDGEEENAPKRQRTEEIQQDEAVEFNEDDIAFQLAAMGQDYGLEPDEYGNGQTEEWDGGTEDYELTQEDSSALFKDLLNDSAISPYSPWDKIIEDGRLADDTRYTALTSMKARKEVWEEWSRDKIKQLREQRANEEKKDPRIPYLAFLQKYATTKLYWPEFKRKYKKEPEMRDSALSDKDREKWYREHINRLKLPQATLKSDLLDLLKSQPLSLLNNTTLLSQLPPAVLSNIKYVSMALKVRDPLIEAFIGTLPPPPAVAADEEDEGNMREKVERERRQRALEERERRVAEEKRRQRRNLELGKERLREEENDIARAMNVTRKGLRDHLMELDQVGTSEQSS